jgi:hypothetical protein
MLVVDSESVKIWLSDLIAHIAFVGAEPEVYLHGELG